MVKFELINKNSNANPPNSEYQILIHPSGKKSDCIELALFNDHRFAFFYWIKWTLKTEINKIPDLITFDWHQDLAYPEDIMKDELKYLDLNNNLEVSFFSWARLSTLNDDHIIAAAYLNQIKDIWVVCKQNRFQNWNEKEYVDYQGNIHRIRKFPNKEALFEKLLKSHVNNIYFDVDLDYFTIENLTSNSGHKFTYMSKKEIEKIFSVESEFMRWIFERMDGFTIALEPEHTGGILKSLKYLSILNKILFDGEIHNWNCRWKHLNE